MTYKDILILLNAGYTKDEISAMDLPDNQQVPQQPSSANDAAAGASSLLSSAPPVSPSPSAGEEEVVPASSSPAMEPAEEPSKMDQLQGMFAELLKTLQSSNRNNAEIPGNIIEPGAQALDTLRNLGGIPAQNN